MSRHVSAEKLALYREELLSPRRRARVRSHLSRCETCAATSSALAAIPDLLARVSAPPMPELLAERIQVALASEATARAGASAQAGGAGDEYDAPAAAAAGSPAPVLVPGRPDLPARARRRIRWPRMPELTSPLVLRALAATGVVVIIAGVGFVLANNQPQSAPGSSGARPATRSAAGGVNHRPAAYAPFSEAITAHYRLKGKRASATVLTSDVNFTRQSFAKEAPVQVHRSENLGTAAPSGAANTTAKGVNIEHLGVCLTAVAAGRRVLVVDLARYLGQRAAIIIMRSLRAIDILDVVVVRLACSATNTHAIARFHVPAG